MADADFESSKDYKVDVPAPNEPFFLKGSNHLDWGMKNRLANIFDARSGRTVMLAFDHGYFLGPTSGLEQLGQTVAPLLPYADCLMLTRGALRNEITPKANVPIMMRMTGGTSIISNDNDTSALSNECLVRSGPCEAQVKRKWYPTFPT